MVRSTEWIILILCICARITTGDEDDYWDDDWFDDKDPNSAEDISGTTETACDGHHISLRCPGTDVVEILSSQYGRQNSDTCSASRERMTNTECSLTGAQQIMETRCNNKTACDVMVTSDTFDDPCPGTHKYLKTTFRCLKFMFRCPGTLIGIGREQESKVNVQPKATSWTKDPLYDSNRVFFASSDLSVHEYETWEKFVGGFSSSTYSLPSTMSKRNFVVYDRNLYYVKANSRNIIRFSLITQSRTKEATIPSSGFRTSHSGQDISLAVDENGLWLTYTKSRFGYITISRLNKDSLEIDSERSWTTTRRIEESLHTFLICGVMYSVNARNGLVDYSYNTNVETDRERKDLDIAFNAPGRRSQGNRRALRYNATFLAYNPRDQLLYSWDASTAKAVYYKLTFDGIDPKEADARSTTTTTTTTTTSRSTPPYESSFSTRSSTTISIATPKPPIPPDSNSCPSTERGGLNWPKTNAGEIARIPCDDDTGGYATYPCIRQLSMREAAWSIAGPDMTQCITWATRISDKYKNGELDRVGAIEMITTEISKNDVTDKSLEFLASLIKKILLDRTTPSREAAKTIIESMSKIYHRLANSDDAWTSLSEKKQSEVAKALVSSLEMAGFLYADAASSEPSDIRDEDPLMVESDEILLEVVVRTRTLEQISSNSVTSFPKEKFCRHGSKCDGDVIYLSDSQIAKSAKDPATIVFGLFQTFGDYLSPSKEQEWVIDSKIISATLTQPNSRTNLQRPVTITLKHKEKSKKPRRCVFWDPEESEGNGNWSTSGCQYQSTNETHTICDCDHLSTFGVQVNQQVASSPYYYDPILDITTKIGISVAVVCLLFCVLTLTCFRNLRSDRNIIHKHFCACLLAAELVFLMGINQTEYAIFCSVVAGLLHYFFIATFIWMALESVQLYGDLKDRNSQFKWYNYLVGYGFPLVVVGISLGIGYDKYGSDQVCWIEVDSGLIWSLVGPIALLIVGNLVFLSMTVCKMYKDSMTFSDAGRINSIKAAVRGASVLLCLLGITWAFGILWLSEGTAILAYLFAVFNAFQGIFIFIFYCVLPRKVRQEYTRCLGRLPCCRKLGRDYVSNSMSFSKPYTPGRYPNGTNGGSQQESLNRPSQLRRMWNETVVTPKTSQSTPITNDVSQTRDVTRGAQCPHRPNGHGPVHNNADPRQRPEDDVFLPPEVEQDNRTENVRLLHNTQGDIEYDRLQYYRCPEHYKAAQQRSYSPQGPYHPSMSPQRHLHPPPNLSPPPPHSSSNSSFGPPYPGQPRSPDLEYLPTHPQANRHDPAHPYYWELDPPLAHHHHHVHQSSIEENVSSGKRDSGISMQHLPPNSMIHRLTSDMQRCEMHRRQSPASPAESQSSSRQTPPGRIPDESLHHSQLHHHHPRYPQNQKRGAFSEDEGQGSSFEDQEKHFSNAKPDIPPPRATTHTPRGVSPPVRIEKPTPIVPDQRRLPSMHSDSDDPIVTDCSGGSTGSSFGRHYRSWSNQENMV